MLSLNGKLFSLTGRIHHLDREASSITADKMGYRK